MRKKLCAALAACAVLAACRQAGGVNIDETASPVLKGYVTLLCEEGDFYEGDQLRVDTSKVKNTKGAAIYAWTRYTPDEEALAADYGGDIEAYIDAAEGAAAGEAPVGEAPAGEAPSGAVIAGATGELYTLTPEDIGAFIAVKVSWAQSEGTLRTEASARVLEVPEGFVRLVDATSERQDAAFVSVGRGKRTFYIDYERGNDAYSGLSPLKPWKTFKNVLSTKFRAGDHILLEADSVWQGTSVTPENKAALYTTDADKLGMLWPKSAESGTAAEPCVIDLYDLEEQDGSRIPIYYNANRRPIINGHGTPAPIDTGKSITDYYQSGAVTLISLAYWEVRNLELTNTFADFSPENPNGTWHSNFSNEDYADGPNHWMSLAVPKALCGVFAWDRGEGKGNKYPGIKVLNCYVHDVQSETSNNGVDIFRSGYFSGGAKHAASDQTKGCGGIMMDGAFQDLLIEGNIVRHVGLEGARTGGGEKDGVVFRGNYVEGVVGDGIVLSNVHRINADTNFSTTTLPVVGGKIQRGLCEYNIVKDTCASPYTGTANYAACWVYKTYDIVLQYNEAYGCIYGMLDGEAWDIDNDSQMCVYQFNYSHHNAGGCILFMSSTTNSLFRYNLSANDGGGMRYILGLYNGLSESDRPSQTPVYQNKPGNQGIAGGSQVESYAWANGESIIHFTVSSSDASTKSRVPLIYNNTFYIGPGVKTALYGNTSTGSTSKYVRFFNNIVLKVGPEVIAMNNTHDYNKSYSYGTFSNVSSGFRSNLLYAYNSDRASPSKALFSYSSSDSGLSDSTFNSTFLGGTNPNVWADPKLLIQEDGKEDELRAQRFTNVTTAYSSTSVWKGAKEQAAAERLAYLRERAKLLRPLEGSPALQAGMPIGYSTNEADFDGSWNNNTITQDLFGAAIPLKSGGVKHPIGASVAPVTP
jgi:hypothetical protein